VAVAQRAFKANAVKTPPGTETAVPASAPTPTSHCEQCGKAPSYGLPGGEVRWCAKCAKSHDGAVKMRTRGAKDLWDSLRPRLLSVVRMQRQWGPLHDIYDSQQASRFDVTPLPRYVRDPDSNFSAVWDLTQVFLLLYVAITVPLRAGFTIEMITGDFAYDIASFGFIFDMFVDLYFISDIVLNFMTAFYNKDGTREERYWPIAIHYMKGWFFIDLVSTLPVAYVPYFISEDAPAATVVRAPPRARARSPPAPLTRVLPPARSRPRPPAAAPSLGPPSR
jgi:hypothetical protein